VPQLRRVEEVRGYRVIATDGDVGTIESFLISEAAWSIDYVVVETTAEHHTRKTVLLPSWIHSIDKGRGTVRLTVPRQVVLGGPEFTEDIQQGYESWLLNELAEAAAPSLH
jgi:hypothetical protein